MNHKFLRYCASLTVGLCVGACSSAPSEHLAGVQANPTAARMVTGVAGSVTLSPGCPGPQVSERNCDQVYRNKVIELLDNHGAVVANTTTSNDGAFSMQAPAGQYTLQVVKQGLYPRCPASPVTIVTGTMVQAALACDSGIR